MTDLGELKVYTGKFEVNTVICGDMAFDPSAGVNIYDKGKVKTVFLTHGHADHFGGAKGISASIVAPRLESNMIENPEINWRGHFNWALLPEDLATPYFQGEGVRVDDFSENYHFSVPLPSHTHAHTGYLVEDSLIAGDSVYPVEYWKKFGILYYTDPDCAIESLKKILELEWNYLIPGHGDVLSRSEGMREVRENIRSIESVDNTILSIIDGEVTESEILARASKIFGLKNVKATLNILKPSVSGHISSLYRRGLIEVNLTNRGITFCRS